MKKLFASIRKYPKSFIITALISLVIGFGIFCIFFFWLGAKSITGAIDGTGVAGAVLFSAFVLIWLSRNGAFDTMSYGFNQMFSSMFGRKANKYNDFADYKDQKNTKREIASLYYFSFLFVAILYLIAFSILEIIFHTLY